MKKVSFFRSIKFQIPVLLCVVLLIPLMLLYQANSSLINDITLQDTKASISGDLSGKAMSVDYVLNEVTQFAQLQGSDAELLEDYRGRNLLVFSSYWAIDFICRRNPGLKVSEIVVEEG